MPSISSVKIKKYGFKYSNVLGLNKFRMPGLYRRFIISRLYKKVNHSKVI